MAKLVAKTRGGKDWTPMFVTALNSADCIGCGRCYNVCTRDVFELVQRSGLAGNYDDDDDFDFEEISEMMVMSIKDEMDCIGCMSCSLVCPKKCHTNKSLEAA